MTVSVADLRRETSDLMNPVKRGKSVDDKAHGKPVASVKPSSKGIDAGVREDSSGFGEEVAPRADG
ncbi:MAG: hypothetical protein WCR07_06405, partial [Verrucomicrobiota bacterium]